MKKLADVKKMLISYRTEPVLQQRLLAMMQQWIGKYEYKIPEGDGQLQTLNAAFRDQNILGIENIFVGVISHKFGEYQQEHYDKMPEKQRKLNQKEWNVAFIRALLQFSGHMWMERCNYLHNLSNMTMEKQMRLMAWKMKEMLVENRWKLRAADRHILKRSNKFFRKAPTQALQGWIERAKVSMSIEFNHEQATRQNITKWITFNGEYVQKLKCKEVAVKNAGGIKRKKYVQTTLHEAFQIGVQDVNSTHTNGRDDNSDWDDIRPQWVFDEYEVDSHIDIDAGRRAMDSKIKHVNAYIPDYGIPEIVIIEDAHADVTIKNKETSDSNISTSNGRESKPVSLARNDTHRCNSGEEIGKVLRSTWFRLKMQALKKATTNYGMRKKANLNMFTEIPSKLGKINDWYINRMEKKKEEKKRELMMRKLFLQKMNMNGSPVTILRWKEEH